MFHNPDLFLSSSARNGEMPPTHRNRSIFWIMDKVENCIVPTIIHPSEPFRICTPHRLCVGVWMTSIFPVSHKGAHLIQSPPKPGCYLPMNRRQGKSLADLDHCTVPLWTLPCAILRKKKITPMFKVPY
jgi:hypothetical protein